MPKVIWCICHKIGISLINEIQTTESEFRSDDSPYKISSFHFTIDTVEINKTIYKVLTWHDDQPLIPSISFSFIKAMEVAIISKTARGLAKFLGIDFQKIT